MNKIALPFPLTFVSLILAFQTAELGFGTGLDWLHCSCILCFINTYFQDHLVHPMSYLYFVPFMNLRLYRDVVLNFEIVGGFITLFQNFFLIPLSIDNTCFPVGSGSKESPCSAGDPGLIPIL